MILACVDLSSDPGPVTLVAVELAVSLHLPLCLFHVAAPDPDFVGYDVGPEPVRDSKARELKQERAELDQLAEKLRAQGAQVDARMVMGATGETIANEIKKLGAKFVVVGHHDRSRLYELFTGSTADYLIRHAGCPVVVVPETAQTP
jgi:nucleotide-binding universal stress UspA family protein